MQQDRLVRLYLADQARQDLKPSELAVLASYLLKQGEQQADQRRRANLKTGTAFPEGEKFPTRGRTVDVVGKVFGTSGKTLRKILEMAEGGYQEQMDQVGLGRIDRVYKKFRRIRRAEEAANDAPQGISLNNVICADCREYLATLQSDTFHAAIVDPPFGIGFDYDGEREACDNPLDYWNWFGPIYKEIVRVTKPGGFICLWQSFQYLEFFSQWYGDWHPFFGCKVNVQIFSDSPFTPAVDPLVMQWKAGAKPLIPVKQDRSYNWFPTTITYGDEVSMQHPCPRPIDLCENLVRNFVIENGIVLDCFTGSGTIPLAVKRVGGGRRFVAIEKNRKYAEVAERRLTSATP